MKYLSFTLLLLLTLNVCSGCRSKHSLDRKPKRIAPAASAPRQNRGKSTRDPLFDTVFGRNRDQKDDIGILSKEEIDLLRGNDPHSERVLQDIYDNGSQERTRRSDWVFGTKNGSFF